MSSILRPVASALSLPALALSLSACSASPPQEVEAPVQAFHHSYSRTWISVVGTLERPEPRHCEHAEKIIAGDSACQGALCRFAAEITSDYAATCLADSAGAERQALEAQLTEFRQRAASPADRCSRPALQWLDKGCGDEGACHAEAQAWATRCSDVVQSPLTIHMLQSRIERTYSDRRRVRLDTRSCTQLSAEVRELSSCENRFACEDTLPKVDAYLATCADGARSVLGISEALVARSILERAERDLPAIAVDPTVTTWQPVSGKLMLPEGKGALLSFCDVAVDSAESALEARVACTDGKAQLLLVRGHDGTSLLQSVNMPFVDNRSMALAAPWLSTTGTTEAVLDAIATGFEEALKALAQAGTSARKAPAAVAAFEETLADLPWELLPEKTRGEIWTRYDRQLVPLFTHLGADKGRAVKRSLDRQRALQYLRRARVLPFADLDAEGEVAIGEAARRLSGLRPGTAAPAAMIAYTKGLKWLERSLSRVVVDDGALTSSYAAYNEATTVCMNALARAAGASKEIEACYLGTASCSDDTTSARVATVTAALSSWQQANARTDVVRATLDAMSTPGCDAWGTAPSAAPPSN